MATRNIRVSRGLFVLRYVSSRGGVNAPEVILSAAHGSGVELISADFVSSPVLRAPGDAIVVRAENDSSILALVNPTQPGGSRDAQFVFERVSVSLPPVQTPARELWFSPVRRRSVVSPSILAHIARRGDVMVNAGDWVCGPQLPMTIEGLQIVWPDRPHDVDIVVACVINSRGRRSVAPAASGTFVGTRGKAAPIVGLSITLTGSNANAYRLSCEALFFGSQVQVQEGMALEFGGSTGHEPLVGLRLTVRDAHASRPSSAALHAPTRLIDQRSEHSVPVVPAFESMPAQEPPMLEPPAATSTSSAPKSGRVRVFRAPRPSSVSQHL